MHFCRFPFDWRNPLGYLIALALQCVVVSYLLLVGSCGMALAIGSYLYFMASNKCIKGNLLSINQWTGGNKNSQQISNQFIEFIQFHSRVKQLSKNDRVCVHFFQIRLHFLDASAIMCTFFSQFSPSSLYGV